MGLPPIGMIHSTQSSRGDAPAPSLLRRSRAASLARPAWGSRAGGARGDRSPMTRRIATAAAALTMLLAAAPARAQGEDESVSRSVVRIFSTKRSPDLYRPWRKKDGEDLTGTGVVIEGRRVLTNAHVA